MLTMNCRPGCCRKRRDGLIVCTGANDTQIEQGHRRLSLQSSIEALNELLLVAELYGRALVVGPRQWPTRFSTTSAFHPLGSGGEVQSEEVG